MNKRILQKGAEGWVDDSSIVSRLSLELRRVGLRVKEEDPIVAEPW